MTKRLLISFLLVLALPAVLLARAPLQQERIEFLLHSIEGAKGARFIRNGSEYDSAAAIKHLRMKLDYGGDRIRTAEDFVKYCATESSLTHRKYSIRLSGNFDIRSIRLNDEANMNVLDRGFAAEQTRLFDADKARSRRSLSMKPESSVSSTLCNSCGSRVTGLVTASHRSRSAP